MEFGFGLPQANLELTRYIVIANGRIQNVHYLMQLRAQGNSQNSNTGFGRRRNSLDTAFGNDIFFLVAR